MENYLGTVIGALDLAAVAVFAAAGALAASRKQLDIFGFAVIATVTGIGGGTLRDLLLGIQPVFWIKEPAYLWVCLGVAGVAHFLTSSIAKRALALIWLDALGMAAYTIVGTEIALANGAHWTIAAAMGVLTASFGGIIRDILCNEIPLIFQREVYATASLAGALVYLLLASADLPRNLDILGGFVAAFGIRALAIIWHWTIPPYRPRAKD
ncbi:MAG: trimeric intracellular cation channel family protein [Alphaproteobacteria bacterium]